MSKYFDLRFFSSILRLFKLRREMNGALQMASTTNDPDDRIRWCDQGLHIAGELNPWPFISFSRNAAIGSLYGMRGQALLELRWRDHNAYSQRAVKDLETAVKLLTKSAGAPWAHLMNILAIAYGEQAGSNRLQNTELAIETLDEALSVLDPDKHRELWIDAMNNLASFYAEREKGNIVENREKHLSILMDLQTRLASEKGSMDWAMVTMNLSHAYWVRNGNKGGDIETAIDLLESALPVFSKEKQDRQMAGALLNLSAFYSDRIEGDFVHNLDRAISANDLVLEMVTAESDPMLWAKAQLNRGGLFAQRKNEDLAINKKTAIRAFDAALTVFNVEDFPVEHGEVLLALSQIRETRAGDSIQANLESAVSDARAALSLTSKETAPQSWARASIVLGNALRRGPGDRRRNIEEAIALFTSSLTVVGPSDIVSWNFAQTSLADAFAERIEGDRAENMERSIELQEEVLGYLDPVTSRLDWSNAMRSLAISYGERILGLKADNTERAVATAEEGLVALNEWEHGAARSRMLETLGEAFEYRVRGNRIDNLGHAVQAYYDASLARNRIDDPEAWLRIRQRRLKAMTLLRDAITGSNRGTDDGYSPLSRQVASLNEDSAVYVEALRDAVSSVSPVDHPRAWALAQEDLASVLLQEALVEALGNETFDGKPKAKFADVIGIYEEISALFPRDVYPQRWAYNRTSMASAYLLMHMVRDLQHRGSGGLADRAKINLPNRSEEAMQYLDLAAERMNEALTVFTVDADAREHLKNAVKLGSYHIWRRDWRSAAAAFASAGVAADRLLGDIEASESEVRNILSALGDLSIMGPFVEAVLGRLPESLRLLETGRARLLAKGLNLASLSLPDSERSKLNKLLFDISNLEKRLAGPNLIDRATPLEKVFQLRADLRGMLGALDPKVLSPEIDPHELLKNIIVVDAAIVIPLFTDAGGRILLICSPRTGEMVQEAIEADDVITLDGIFTMRIADGLESWQKSYNDFIYSKDLDRWSQALHGVSKSLGMLIAEPVLRKLDVDADHRIRRLDILPQGPLGLLPLNLAADPVSGKMLVDYFEISLSPSLVSLNHGRNKSRHSSPPRSISFVRSTDASLPDVIAEGEIVSSWFDRPGFVIQAGDQASADSILGSLQDSDIWHFACHGEFDPDFPLRSHLGPFGDDEFITLEDIFNARYLCPPELVVLSACSTGVYDARELPAEFIGFPTAFLQLGATAVVGTLWPVLDIVAALLIGRFYEEYLGRGESTCRAVRNSQLWLRDARIADLERLVEHWLTGGRLNKKTAERFVDEIKNFRRGSENAPFADPVHWSGFVHFGA